jgi:hypothetical protein
MSATNTFVADILTAKKTVQELTGVVPNTLVMDYSTFLGLQNCSTLMDRIKYTQMGVITEQLIAAMLQLDSVIIGKGIYTTQAELQPENTTFTSVNIWEYNSGKGSAFLYYKPPSAGLRTPAPGYQYRLNEGGSVRQSVSYREESNHQTVFEVLEWIDISIMSTDLGYLWKDTSAT